MVGLWWLETPLIFYLVVGIELSSQLCIGEGGEIRVYITMENDNAESTGSFWRGL